MSYIDTLRSINEEIKHLYMINDFELDPCAYARRTEEISNLYKKENKILGDEAIKLCIGFEDSKRKFIGKGYLKETDRERRDAQADYGKAMSKIIELSNIAKICKARSKNG